MSNRISSDAASRDVEGVRQFFDQWHLYKKVVGLDYLSHRAGYAAIGKALDRFSAPFSFLDLGAGDAEWTTGILASRQLSSYEAVDLSSVALELARNNAVALNCPVKLTQADFFSFVQNDTTPRDVVFIGLSLHHLLLPEKKRFFESVRKIIAPGGSLIFYEPINDAGETRDEYLQRWWTYAQREWTALTPEELQQVHGHIFGNDYPESVEDFTRLTKEAGFAATDLIYEDPARFYAVLHCH